MTVAAAQVNWTQVLVYGVPAWIAAVFAGLASLRARKNGQALQTPSGDSIGCVVERGHDLSAITVAATTGAKGPVVTEARKRLNGGRGAQLEHLPTPEGEKH